MDVSNIEILIVDDDPDSQALVEKILHFYGFKTTAVTDGKAVLAYCDDHHPQLILMDLGLPDMDGTQVVLRLREKEWCKQTPILAFTANPLHKGAQMNLFSGVLIKPFTPQELMSKIKELLAL